MKLACRVVLANDLAEVVDRPGLATDGVRYVDRRVAVLTQEEAVAIVTADNLAGVVDPLSGGIG